MDIRELPWFHLSTSCEFTNLQMVGRGPADLWGKNNTFFFVVSETLLESPWIWRWPSFKKKNRERREMKVDSLPSNGHFLFGKETKWRFGFRHLIHMVSDDMNFLKQNVFVFLFAVI